MTNYIAKALFILLVYVLLFRTYLKWTKNSPKKIIPVITGIIAVAAGTAAVFLLTLFEVLICLTVICAVFLFRKKIRALYRDILSSKYGKFKSVGLTVASVLALWMWLALFYRTDFGMPIGVQNYLFHKYNEEFEVSGFFGATIAGHPTNQLTCYPKNGNKATDCFNVARKNTLSIGSKRFASDNYYGIIIRDDYEKYVSDIVSKYFDEFKVYARFEYSGLSNVKYMSDELNKSTSLEDFLEFQRENQRGCNSVYITIHALSDVSAEEAEMINNSLVDDIRKNISLASVFLNIFNDEEYNKINRTYFENNKMTSKPIQFSAVIDYKYEATDTTYRPKNKEE